MTQVAGRVEQAVRAAQLTGRVAVAELVENSLNDVRQCSATRIDDEIALVRQPFASSHERLHMVTPPLFDEMRSGTPGLSSYEAYIGTAADIGSSPSALRHASATALPDQPIE
jgi:hypothetical protein